MGFTKSRSPPIQPHTAKKSIPKVKRVRSRTVHSYAVVTTPMFAIFTAEQKLASLKIYVLKIKTLPKNIARPFFVIPDRYLKITVLI